MHQEIKTRGITNKKLLLSQRNLKSSQPHISFIDNMLFVEIPIKIQYNNCNELKQLNLKRIIYNYVISNNFNFLFKGMI